MNPVFNTDVSMANIPMSPVTNGGQPKTECFHGEVDQFATNHKEFSIQFGAFLFKKIKGYKNMK